MGGKGLGIVEMGVWAPNMISAADFLQTRRELGFSGPEVAHCFFSGLIFFRDSNFGPQATKVKTVEYLYGILGLDNLKAVVLNNPQILNQFPETLEVKLDFFRDTLGILPAHLPKFLVVHHTLLTFSIPTMNLKMQSWLDLGVSKNVCVANPGITLRKNLNKGEYPMKLFFLENVLQRDPVEYLTEHPGFMHHSLVNVLVPRTAYLEEIGVDIVTLKSLTTVFSLAPKRFVEKYGQDFLKFKKDLDCNQYLLSVMAGD